MSRESNLGQIEAERVAIEQQVSAERGPDELLAAPNPGVIVLPSEGPANFPLGLSGSLTKLTTGEDYLVAGSNVTLVTASNGSIVISAVGGSTPGGGDTEVQFNDGGTALSGSSTFTFDKVTNTLRVTNLSGSLTKLRDGSDYLRAGTGILLTTSSNGSITIDSTLPGNSTWQSYTPTIGATTTAPNLPTSRNLYGKYVVQCKMLSLMFSLSWNSSAGSTAGSGTYTISLPPGFSIDTTAATLGTAPTYISGTPVGVASLIADIVGTGGGWAVVPNAATTLVLIGQNPASNSQPLPWGSSNFYMGQSSEFRLAFTVTIPVV